MRIYGKHVLSRADIYHCAEVFADLESMVWLMQVEISHKHLTVPHRIRMCQCSQNVNYAKYLVYLQIFGLWPSSGIPEKGQGRKFENRVIFIS